MAAKTLDQVISELQNTYQPQVDSLQKQQSMIPDQIAQQEQGLQAKQTSAFGDILNGARQRGLGFSGIPLQEQAKYTATDYLPAVANLHTAGIQQATSLQDAINSVLERRNTLAQQLVDQSQQQDLAERQFQAKLAAQKAAAAAAFNPSYGSSTGQQAPAQSSTGLEKYLKNPTAGGAGGYNLKDLSGQNTSAENFAKYNGIDIHDLLYTLAQSGDPYAANAYQAIVNNNGNITDDIKRRFAGIFNAPATQATQAPAGPAYTPASNKITNFGGNTSLTNLGNFGRR